MYPSLTTKKSFFDMQRKARGVKLDGSLLDCLFDPAVGAKLWGAALVLLALVFLLSLLALPSRLKLHEEAND